MKNLFTLCMGELSASKAGFKVFLVLFFLSFLTTVTYAQKLGTVPVGYASYAIDKNGNLYLWGYDQYNHLVGTNTGAPPTGIVPKDSTPVKVAFPSGVTAWVAVAGGQGHTLAIGNNGNLYAWGLNNYGQLGNGTIINDSIPEIVPFPNSGVTGWSAVAAACFSSYAIGNDGNLYAWGHNNEGQLGNGTTTDSYSPVMVHLPSGVTAKAISAGGLQNQSNSALAIGSNDTLYAWGRNVDGQLGIGNTTDQATPVVFPLPAGVTPVKPVSGDRSSAVLCSDGNIYESGFGGYGQLGNGTTASSLVPINPNKPSGVSSWKALFCGSACVFAIGDNDSLYAWGGDGNGQLGVATGANHNPSPVKVTLPNGVTAIAVSGGDLHSFAIGSDSLVYAWGNNVEGQLGINNTANPYASSTKTTPVHVLAPGGIGYFSLGTGPEVPTLVSPANNAINQPTSLTLKWSKAPHAAGYLCQVSADPTFATKIVVNDSVSTDTTDNISGLGTSTPYYWHVRSYNNGVLSAFSNIDTFTTVMSPPGAPTLISPANNAVNRPHVDSLVCSKATGAAQYHWQVSTALGFSTFAVNDTTTDTVNVVTLMSGTKYYWQVQAVNPGGVSAFAVPDSFTVMTAPAAPSLVAPAGNATYQRADTLTLMWRSVTGATGYSLQLSDSLSFSHIVFSRDSVSAPDTMYAVTKLNNLQKYYWRVGAYNVGGLGSYSAPDSFTTIIAVPAKPVLASPSQSSTGVPRKATLDWNRSTIATRYHVEIATDYHIYTSGDSAGAFLSQNVVFDTTLTDTIMKVSNPFAADNKYYWHVAGIDTAGMGAYSDPFAFTTGTGIDAVDEPVGIPKEFALLQNFPNPFNPSTVIKYNLPKAQFVTLMVYNVLGQVVATLVNTRQNPGYYDVTFNADRFASGVYFYMLRAGSFTAVQKMMLLK